MKDTSTKRKEEKKVKIKTPTQHHKTIEQKNIKTHKQFSSVGTVHTSMPTFI